MYDKKIFIIHNDQRGVKYELVILKGTELQYRFGNKSNVTDLKGNENDAPLAARNKMKSSEKHFTIGKI